MDLHHPHPSDPYFVDMYELWKLGGEVRPSLMKLKSLRYLDLSFNSFNGIPIPAFLGSLENLQYLNLSNAGFSGKIPPNLGNLSSLEYLDVSSCYLYLVFDNLEFMAGLVSLKHLVMNAVNLSMVGSHWVAILNKLPSLTELHLSSCSLSGDIPSLQVYFTSLAVINLNYNNLNSEVPDWLVNISSLEYVDISSSQLYGRIPLGSGDLPSLKILNLAGNNELTASCFQLFRRKWKKIEVLDLNNNNLHGKFPASIGELCNLNYFDLSSNNLKGTLPESLEGTENCHSRSPLPRLLFLEL